MRRRLSRALLLALALAPWPAAAKDKQDEAAFAATAPLPPAPAPANGAIFQGGSVPLTSGGRADRVGDIITIQLATRTIASKSSASGTNRDSSFGRSTATTGPLSHGSEEHTSELTSLTTTSYGVFIL